MLGLYENLGTAIITRNAPFLTWSISNGNIRPKLVLQTVEDENRQDTFSRRVKPLNFRDEEP